jgi:hypothetical protein
MTERKVCVIMDNTMDGFLSILILILGSVAAALIALFFGKIGK